MITRLKLRTLAVNALTPQPYDLTPPTMAGYGIYDSRIDPISNNQIDVNIPSVTVYTLDHTDSVDDKLTPGHVRAWEYIDLHIDMAVGTFTQTSVDQYEYEPVTTDAETEAFLDILEQSVYDALMHPNREASQKFQGYVVEIMKYNSSPERLVSNNRIAFRGATFKCKVKPTCHPEIVRSGDPRALTVIPDITSIKDITGVDYLDAMIVGLLSNPDNRVLAEMILRQHGYSTIVDTSPDLGYNITVRNHQPTYAPNHDVKIQKP